MVTTVHAYYRWEQGKVTPDLTRTIHIILEQALVGDDRLQLREPRKSSTVPCRRLWAGLPLDVFV